MPCWTLSKNWRLALCPGAKPAKIKFNNARPKPKSALLSTIKTFWQLAFAKSPHATPQVDIPVRAISAEELAQAADGSLYRLGHSTVLLKLRGQFFLTDPVFSLRASPLQWLGPKRFHAPPITLEDLPAITAVILSHNHYDHLDCAAVKALDAKTQLFLTPLGVGEALIKWGINADKIRQFDWWQGCEYAGIHWVATPAQHFSGRGLNDGNITLWASWVIIDGDTRLFFSGDSGYFAGFKHIGERYGPFDVTLMETGAYNPAWAHVHMHPHETLQAHKDLQGRVLLPIHNGTFSLSIHAWYDPFERIAALADAENIHLCTPQMGELVNIPAPARWWKPLIKSAH
jgi:L-ascorbate metabolism protein UlaG (beta-lactamase superfamily)